MDIRKSAKKAAQKGEIFAENVRHTHTYHSESVLEVLERILSVPVPRQNSNPFQKEKNREIKKASGKNFSTPAMSFHDRLFVPSVSACPRSIFVLHAAEIGAEMRVDPVEESPV